MAKKTKTVKYTDIATLQEVTKEIPLDDDVPTLNIQKEEPPKKTAVDKANEVINKEYPWAVPSLTAPQRAMLCELIRARLNLEDD